MEAQLSSEGNADMDDQERPESELMRVMARLEANIERLALYPDYSEVVRDLRDTIGQIRTGGDNSVH